ncbi:hypothetical protein [Ruminiclostridium cellobioparum]|uniref:hypothetical protein n=1 Tax=Ruminiclostridium cellobioparum TaxID=29355 RepID=UPI00048A0D13|nr:hypothetical protein [Ruminiclostridium cellobioparum]
MNLKKLLAILMMCIFMTSLLGTANAQEEKKDPQCLTMENEKINSLYPDGKIPLVKDKPLTIKFDDGTYITYKLAIEKVNSEEADSSSVAAASIVSVEKDYYYGFGSAMIILYTQATWTGNSVTIQGQPYTNRTGAFVTYNGCSEQIIRATGIKNSYAIAEASGNFSILNTPAGSPITRSYKFQIQLDPILPDHGILVDMMP